MHHYSVSISNIFMWICEIQLVFIMECSLVYEHLEAFFPFQNMHVEDAHTDQLSITVSEL